jgi:glycerol-3-phosphate dehydrogenase (NAD(P)+)
MSAKIVAVLGAGGWGVAISNLLCEKGNLVKLWEFDEGAARKLRDTRVIPAKLPGVKLSTEVVVINDIVEAIADADFICLVVPAQTIRSVCKTLASAGLGKRGLLINFSKGIEVGSLLRMSEILAEVLTPDSYSGICTLSGPSHAEEVARNIPTAVVAASKDAAAATAVQELFITPRFRVYTSYDILGVELAGSLKNIIALAAGMLDGLGMGDNTRGALITRGLAEIARIGKKLGADPLTFSGLSGIGDLVTTCLSRHSRNRFVGEQIGRGRKLDTVLAHMTMVAEGVETTKSGYAMSLKHDVEMPITAQVHQVLFEYKPPLEAINDLMVRDRKAEGPG